MLSGASAPEGAVRRTAEQCLPVSPARQYCAARPALRTGRDIRKKERKLIYDPIDRDPYQRPELGSIYALMALGYTMVYGIAKMLNFAHGDIIMVGAYAVVTSVLTLGMPPLVAILISIAVCALLGITVEFLAYRPLRQAPAVGGPDHRHRCQLSAAESGAADLRLGAEAFPVLFTIPSVELGGVYIDGITIATMR